MPTSLFPWLLTGHLGEEGKPWNQGKNARHLQRDRRQGAEGIGKKGVFQAEQRLRDVPKGKHTFQELKGLF